MNTLRNMIKGNLWLPGDAGFDEARTPWNLSDQRVAAVVEAAGPDDVAATVGHAALHGLSVTTQGTGHGAATADGVVLLRTHRLDSVEITDGVARVGGGAKWGAVLSAAGPLGLTGIAGSSPVVGVTGYTLGGGLGWFSRKYGLATADVLAADVVDASGAQVRVTAESDPELFWALRGGGGDFGVVTALEFALRPAPVLYGGRMMWPAERAPEVLAAFREVTADAPEELTVWFDLLKFPDGPGFVTIDSTYLGEHPGDLLRPFDAIGGAISDTRAVMPVADLGTICDEPTDPTPSKGRAELLTGLDDAVAAILLDDPIEPMLSVQVRHLGGALARPSGGAAGPYTEPYLVYMVGLPIPGTPERMDALSKALVPHTSGRKPYTMLHGGEQAASAFDAETLARLHDLKRARDPHGVIRANHPIL
ncbi:FAD-binding oxidoreductase [Nonomuraea sp. NPDC048826]|uniref:FAD-binding oxidoreductase n=1 Tax=Nonomuraea sp. NPDC048826 TaxID=3364347 RepID=UPI0037154C96